ncbi:MAG TPA: hypothetical protein VF541_10500 [Longimicrobium sp.]|jgi:hypothetical protein
MNRLRLLGCSAVALALAPTAALACSMGGYPIVQSRTSAYLVATSAADTLEAGPGAVRYRVSTDAFGRALDRAAVYGQVAEVERIGGPAARGLDPSVKRVVLVPWSYGPDCRTVPWTSSARWVEPGTHGLFMATLRDRRYWAGGIPTFDVFTPYDDPYPQRADPDRYDAAEDSILLSIDEYLSVLEMLPMAEDADSIPAERAFAPLMRWAGQRPALARRYPLRQLLGDVRNQIGYERLRRIEPPLAGTYRFELRLGSGAPRVFYARTRARPTTSWNTGPGYDPDYDAADGYEMLSAGALLPDSLPVDCGPSRDMSREGYVAVKKEPEPGSGGNVWLGKVELGLVVHQFRGDSALARFARDEFAEFSERADRGEPDLVPARFVRSGGQVRVEQVIRLRDGRTLRLTGTRISRATIAEP